METRDRLIPITIIGRMAKNVRLLRKGIFMSQRLCTFLFLAVFILTVPACAHKQYYKSANEAYSIGDYDRAVYMSVEALKAKSDYPEAIALVQSAAPLAYQSHVKRAADYEDRQDYDSAVSEYNAIERLIAAVFSVRKDISFADVSTKKDSASSKAADAHYNRGQLLLKDAEGAKDDGKYKQAANEFHKAQEFAPNYKDSAMLYEKARKGAAVRIAVLPFGDAGYTKYGSAVTEQVISSALKLNPEFLEFVTREHLYQLEKEKELGQLGFLDPKTAVEMGNLSGAQYVVTGKVISATVDSPKRIDNKGTSTCRIREKKDQYRNGSVSWTTHELKSMAAVNSSYQIIDVKTGRIFAADTVKGDENCLPWEVSNFSNKKQTVADSRMLLGKALEKASGEIAGKLVGKFK
ncbi:MAG: hypothetical protein HZB81_06460 [Deltaproteobacteria bacterium]|nr:hypothetical protein [Deltaproteobacteria bacterium]